MLVKEEAKQLRKKKILTEWLKQIEPSPTLDFNHLNIAKMYLDNGATCLSVLTEEKHFLGKLDYIKEALRINKIGLDGLDEVLKNYEINNKNIESLIEGFYNNFLDSKEANLALEKHLVSINNQWTIQEEVKWWEENKQYSILNWRTSDEYLQLMSDKSQNTLNPDPDFVVSDSYPKNIVRLYCDNV